MALRITPCVNEESLGIKETYRIDKYHDSGLQCGRITHILLGNLSICNQYCQRLRHIIGVSKER